MGSRLHGNVARRRRTHIRHSRAGGNPRRDAGDCFPSPRERRVEAPHTHPSFSRRRESTEGRRRWGSRLHGNDGWRRRTHIRLSRAGANPRRGRRRWLPVSTGTTGGGATPTSVIPATAGIHGGTPAVGFPSPRERRVEAPHPTFVIPTQAGIHGGTPAMGFRLHGNDGWRRRTPHSSFPRRRESTEGRRRWGSRLHGNVGGRIRTLVGFSEKY